MGLARNLVLVCLLHRLDALDVLPAELRSVVPASVVSDQRRLLAAPGISEERRGRLCGGVCPPPREEPALEVINVVPEVEPIPIVAVADGDENFAEDADGLGNAMEEPIPLVANNRLHPCRRQEWQGFI